MYACDTISVTNVVIVTMATSRSAFRCLASKSAQLEGGQSSSLRALCSISLVFEGLIPQILATMLASWLE